MDVNTSARSIKRRIGVQLQSTSLLPDLTVFEQVQLFAKLYRCWPGRDEIVSLRR
jgi:ABC-type multidrug transport system ATPase subunit